MTANGYKVSFWGDENVLEWKCLYHTVNIFNATGLYTLKWVILYYVNVTSIKMEKPTKDRADPQQNHSISNS